MKFCGEWGGGGGGEGGGWGLAQKKKISDVQRLESLKKASSFICFAGDYDVEGSKRTTTELMVGYKQNSKELELEGKE